MSRPEIALYLMLFMEIKNFYYIKCMQSNRCLLILAVQKQDLQLIIHQDIRQFLHRQQKEPTF